MKRIRLCKQRLYKVILWFEYLTSAVNKEFRSQSQEYVIFAESPEIAVYSAICHFKDDYTYKIVDYYVETFIPMVFQSPAHISQREALDVINKYSKQYLLYFE